jgi:hypothetical protein
MSRDRMQRQRFEQKYMLNEDQAQAVRSEVAAHLDLDENGVGQPNFSYPVHSLYLDSADLYTFWTTINGDKNRFKLRLRFYDDRPNTPVFFEIKRRINNCILKQRGGVRKDAVARLLRGCRTSCNSRTKFRPFPRRTSAISARRTSILFRTIHA